jgi:anti-sigma regulatory factor (Ser/Thr protein kinase)
MQDISLHLLDIIENSIRAKARNIWLLIKVLQPDNRLKISVKDDGSGMDYDTINAAQDPFYTTKIEREKKVGLGIPLFKESTERCNGIFEIESVIGKGTVITAEMDYNHIDRLPLGSIADTVITSILGHENVNLHLEMINQKSVDTMIDFKFSTALVRKELGDIPLTYPDVITFLSEMISEGIKKTDLEEN